MSLSLSRAEGLAGAGEALKVCAGTVQSSAGLDQREAAGFCSSSAPLWVFQKHRELRGDSPSQGPADACAEISSCLAHPQLGDSEISRSGIALELFLS